ncbi:DUF6491 family protein [Aromatoleum petrolei]|uniref:Uncharacterized protein n=1 Tax=Aromatoleum petrolei TaxID=76116 RepID=A0ABX1MSR2_9RHOO|nr:DUF6491 family protein [Aromatoleum petrolei]NMF90276.1 hypothetical protein [Aromatoleum petrolei]QTQ35550.1 Uncharacterized protein ToN1_13900 [Aromatoleum petrolei]
MARSFLATRPWRLAATWSRLALLGAFALHANAPAAGWESAAGEPAANSSQLVAGGAGPQRAVRVFRVYGWHALEPHAAIIWLGVDEPYVIRLAGQCSVAADEVPSVLVLRDNHLVPGRDRLVLPAGECTIDSLLRADRNKLRASAITPDGGVVVRLIHDAGPRRRK